MRSSERAATPAAKKGPSEPFWKLTPEVLRMIRPQPWLLVSGFALMIFNRVSSLVLPMTSKYFIDGVMVHHRSDLLKPLVAIVLGAAILQGLTSFSLTQIISKAAQRMITELRKRVQSHVARLPIAYYDSNKTGQLVSRIMSDVEGVRNLIGTGMIDFFGGILTAVISFGFLIHISHTLTGVALAVILVFGIGLRKAFAVIRPIFRERPKITAEVTGRLTESLGGVRVVKGYHAEAREEEVFGAGVKRLLDNILKTLTATSLMSLISTSLYGIVSALVMYYGGRAALSSSMTAGVFVQYTMFLGMVVAPVFQIVSIGTQISEAMAGLERTRDLLREVPEEADPKRTVEIGPVSGEVQFENVSFGYDAAKMVLNDVSFVSRPDTATALVGPSGAGKSTIIGLIAAFYTPNAGRVLVDGVDLSTVKLSSFRTQLGVVLQETFLFDGTIRENVAFSRPQATNEEVLTACRIARVDEFAEKFEKGYDTIIGERGVKLSGGQRQRVSIARALLADPRILILDEATSSLDSESEALIQEGLAQLMRGRTTFVIAHRLSTIRRAEQILVIEEGRVVERGTHAALYKSGGRYYEMYTRQHGLVANLFLAPGEEPEEAPETEKAPRVGNLGEAEPTLSDAFGVKPVNTTSS